jgi:acetyl esterase/lipase
MAVTPRRAALALALLLYARNTTRNLRQQHALLRQNEPRLAWLERTQAALKYTSTGQLIASSEYLLALVKPQLAARIGRLLLWTPRDCRVNCRYGPHERNTLDVYGVRAEGASRPVLVFMHGGAWSFGHKWQYALVGEYLAAQGFVVAVLNYRTFPRGSVADMVEDVERAVRMDASLRAGDASAGANVRLRRSFGSLRTAVRSAETAASSS